MSISCLHRWVAVILFCITSFGGYFSMDILSPLQSQLMVDVGIDEVYFLGLHTAYNWSYCIFSLLGGPLLSRITTRTGGILFSLTSFFGAGLVWMGSMIRNYWLIIIGRIFSGSGLCNCITARNCATQFFFEGTKEMSLAFGFGMSFSRVGSVLNLFFSPFLASLLGYKMMLMISFIICGVSVVASIFYFCVEKKAEGIKVNSSGKTNRASAENKMRLKDLLQFPIQFWLLVFVTPFCYSTVNCVVAVIVDFLKTEFDVSSFTAGLYSSIIYLVSLVGCSISGAVADYFGCRLTLLLLSAIFLCAFISFLALSNVLPVIPLVFGGLSYSIYASLIWSFVPIILPSHCAATGNALLSFSSSFVSGILSLVIGAIIREMGYRSALMTTLITSSLCFLLVLVMKWIDKGNKSALDALNLRCYKKVVDN
ncbi:putative sodium glucose transporter [Monocercomonoides exilis]|uniref:putative sodium glucose transporter n=1 Tax=Monocercomonoides exilis TaxID=2049356 RepID=UPI003559A271|nr:putative sodium glucose transporter [Monocercomonoides exilis]